MKVQVRPASRQMKLTVGHLPHSGALHSSHKTAAPSKVRPMCHESRNLAIC